MGLDDVITIIEVPVAYREVAGEISDTITGRLKRTSMCNNKTWHMSAPVRTLELCPACPVRI